MFEAAKVKHVPEDFIVRESAALRLVPERNATERLLLMRKRGFTTMEAVRLIADTAGVPEGRIGYCGLKDEDGVTEQLIGLPADAPFSFPAGGWTVRADQENWITLHQHGFSDSELGVGRMEGNSFRIVLRNLDAEEQQILSACKKLNFLFLNYFDTQRFGVPGGPKKSHLVGGAMLAGRWDEALATLVELRAPESAMAAAWTSTSQELFSELDSRTSAFFLSAHASYEWNRSLRNLVAERCGDRRDARVDGLDFTFLESAAAVAKVMAATHELPSPRYTFVDGTPRIRMSTRPTVVQTIVEIEHCREDEHFPGRGRVELSFFLPSGAYATTAIRQLLLQL
ncbi:tRNA pseudouridine(13) synthase TruD [Streptomyces sp. NPDC005953]|uniref:tRNA pseudouridine(13) synthase TruD n=1 Tax=Streptomyces sp. NPDC005953 TaxID=3156719 RepID=UPI0033C6A0D3